ncbi:DNA repair protein RadC [Lapidilactobacillus achengensis]|uniref:DNA repair protein RadC n=1 Tax=Lapidilactobacillus achengensis TaxID=2486000 RepID=A0ABW1UTB4_9LACO|nr:DNA repair protein RadC [Lapidilactobacillus achengensis]
MRKQETNVINDGGQAATMITLRPRETVYQHGVSAATDQELLQIILRTGTAKWSTAQLAAQLLQEFGNLAFLARGSLAELTRYPGIGPTKAIELQAAFELGRRSLRQMQLRQGVVLSSRMLGQEMVKKFRGCQQEQLVVVYLDTKNQVIQERIIFTGGLNSSVAHPREIYHYAVLLSAARLICLHNHPSGQTTPSSNDLEFSKRLVQCGELMGIECLDHLIIGHDNYLSLREEDLL